MSNRRRRYGAAVHMHLPSSRHKNRPPYSMTPRMTGFVEPFARGDVLRPEDGREGPAGKTRLRDQQLRARSAEVHALRRGGPKSEPLPR